MTPNQPRTSRSYSRRLMWLAVFIVVLFGGYSAAWVVLADKLSERTNAVIGALNTDKVKAECGNMTVRGYPFRLGVYCDTIAYQSSGQDELVATVGGLRTAAQVYDPLRIVGELDGPLRARIPGHPQIWLDWDNLRASTRIARPLPSLISAEARGLSAQTDPDEGLPVMLFSAGQAQMHLRPNGTDIDLAGSVSDLQIDPEAAGGRTLPVLAGSADVTLANGVNFIRERRKSLRGQSGTIRELAISLDEKTGVTLAGTFSVAEDGLIDADLTVALRNPQGAAPALATAVPEIAGQVNSAIGGLALLGNSPSLPLKIVKGRASLGFIPLGEIPPLS